MSDEFARLTSWPPVSVTGLKGTIFCGSAARRFRVLRAHAKGGLGAVFVALDEELNRFAGEIRDRLCGFTARDLKKNEILRAATANDAAQILTEMDAVLRERGRRHRPQRSCSIRFVSTSSIQAWAFVTVITAQNATSASFRQRPFLSTE